MADLKIIKNDTSLLDMKQASEYLNIKTSTLYSMCMRKQIPVVKIGKLNRFRRCDLYKWIESHIQDSKSVIGV